MNCKATILQGEKKGSTCTRAAQNNGYCGKHQSIAQIERDKENGLHKCLTNRCQNCIEPQLKYCKECLVKKEEVNKDKIKCKATIDQGSKKGELCTRLAKESGYCGKHEERHLLLEEAKTKNTRICDDGKRGCHNETENNKSRCENCLEKDRLYENNVYHARKSMENVCVTCGKCIITPTKHLTNNTYLNKCENCVIKMRNIETNRVRSERNYKQEYKNNVATYYRIYQKNAINRNLGFYITMDEFTDLINKECFYCNIYTVNQVNGIDRIDSNKEYHIINVVPCCDKCNIKKGAKNIYSFIKDIISEELCDTKIKLLDSIKDIIEKLPNKITINDLVNNWNTKKEEFINSWKDRKYSDTFISNISSLEYTENLKELIEKELYDETTRI